MMTGTDLSGATGCLVGRVWDPEVGPLIVTLREDVVIDITSREAATMRDLMELPDPVEFVKSVPGRWVCDLADLEHESLANAADPAGRHLLAPCDLQAVKAAGVTFASSMVERVIEERAAGDPQAAQAIRERIGGLIGASLADIVPGSDHAAAVKDALVREGLWSQYLEVGIGPDAEIFSKAQPMSAVGWGAPIGLHPKSVWNNPEPEIVLVVNSSGDILGATLGNDVNLRDFEGRSALLLSKAKDNNASASIGPFLRLFDDAFGMDDIRNIELHLTVTGVDGFVLRGASTMRMISRDPEDLVGQTINRDHQYPDGLVLYLGTLFAPNEDRDVRGAGFTHKIGDAVEISAGGLGVLSNHVKYSSNCRPWSFGSAALMRNLAGRNLL